MADAIDGTSVPVTSTLAESEEEYLESPLEVPRAKRAQGQWEMGYREPLTPQEQNKRNQDGLDVYDRIINDYAVNGWDSIDPADLGGRFPSSMASTQRPERQMFMMRIRAPAPGDLGACVQAVGAELAAGARITHRQTSGLLPGRWV